MEFLILDFDGHSNFLFYNIISLRRLCTNHVDSIWSILTPLPPSYVDTLTK